MPWQRERLRRALQQVALQWGQGFSRQGTPYGWLLDCRQVLLDPRLGPLAGRLLWQRLRSYRPESIAGMTMAAHPLAVHVQQAAAREGHWLDVQLIRREPKGDGLRRQIEGPQLTPGQRVALVDDLINSGETQQAAFAALRPARVRVVAVATLLDYQRAGSAWLQDQGVALEALFSLVDLGLSRPAAPELHPDWVMEGLNSGQYPAPKSTPWVTPRQLLVGSDRGAIVAIDREGKQRWRYPVRDAQRGVHASPLCYRGKVYAGAYDGFFYCLDERSGRLLWERHYADWIGSSPILAEGRLVLGLEFGEMGGSLVALDLDTGDVFWEVPVGEYLHSTPCYSAPAGVLVAAANDGIVRGLQPATGLPLWRFYTSGPVQSSLSCDRQRVYVAGGDGVLYALELQTGELLWSRRLGRRLYCKPLLLGNLVIAGGDSGALVALDRRQGCIRWVCHLAAPMVGGATRGPENEVWVGTCAGDVLCISSRGELRGQFRARAAIRQLPAADRRQLFIADMTGRLYAFSASRHSQVQRS